MKSQIKRIVFLSVVLQLISFQYAEAKLFKNAYISFDILDTWNCNLSNTEWVCRSTNPQEAREAVIILTAKEKGPTDTYPIYLNHMSKPMTMNLIKGGTQLSTVTIPPRENKINNQVWYDALHINSEVPSYYTRYLATIKDQVAILVTFSAHTKYYSKHSTHFMNTIQSLKVIAPKDILSRTGVDGMRDAKGNLLGDKHGIDPSLLLPEEGHQGGKGGFTRNQFFIGGLLLLLLILGYVAYKVYRKK